MSNARKRIKALPFTAALIGPAASAAAFAVKARLSSISLEIRFGGGVW
jgi:hypothetical protein